MSKSIKENKQRVLIYAAWKPTAEMTVIFQPIRTVTNLASKSMYRLPTILPSHRTGFGLLMEHRLTNLGIFQKEAKYYGAIPVDPKIVTHQQVRVSSLLILWICKQADMEYCSRIFSFHVDSRNDQERALLMKKVEATKTETATRGRK